MATLNKGYTFGATEQVTNAKLHALVDSGTISGIVNADIDASAAIAGTKFADVDGGKLTGLANVASGAGVIPAANLTSVAQSGANSDITSLSGLTTPLSTTQGGTGLTGLTQGDIFYDNGVAAINRLAAGTSGQVLTTGGAGANPSWAAASAGGWNNMEVFTSSGTWTKPASVSKVLVKVVGGGGGGGGNIGAGGGAGGYSEGFVSVTGNVTVTIGAGGTGGASGSNTATAGGTSSFAGGTTPQATGGALGALNSATASAGGAGSAGTLNCVGESGQGGQSLDGGAGDGGSSVFGGGGRNHYSAVGYAATGYGGGGGGGASGRAGGAGFAGVVIVYWNE